MGETDDIAKGIAVLRERAAGKLFDRYAAMIEMAARKRERPTP